MSFLYPNSDFYSWAIRHSAVLGLSRICKVCQHVPVKDGFSTVAWKKLTERHSSEKEDRVLEAYKLSQVKFLNQTITTIILDRVPYTNCLCACEQ